MPRACRSTSCPTTPPARSSKRLQSNAWDICFLAIDPLRAADISFTAPYVVIEGVYLVAERSPIRDNAEVDRPGMRVGVIVGSAYDLFLSRELKQASIVRAQLVRSGARAVDQGRARLHRRRQAAARSRRAPHARPAHAAGPVHGDQSGDGNAARPRRRREISARLRRGDEGVGLRRRAFARHRIEGASMAPAATPRDGAASAPIVR